MGTHPAISTIGERRKFYTQAISAAKNESNPLRCSCGKPFLDCDHWTKIKTKLGQQFDLDGFETNPTEFQLIKNKQLNQVVKKAIRFAVTKKVSPAFWPRSKKLKEQCFFNQKLVETILAIDHKSIFLDSSKVIDHVIYLSQIKNIDLKVIWLARDPRAQVFSALKYNAWSVEEAAKNWKTEMAINEKILRAMNITYQPLKYESLCRDPKKEMTQVLEFTGLDPAGFSLDFRQGTQHIMGNAKMRLGSDEKIKERKDWKEHFSPSQIKKIEELTVDYRHYYAPD